MTLHWRYATKADRRLRQGFRCAIPERREYRGGRLKYHPRPWELEVQTILRERPVPAGEWLLLGLEPAGPIAAAVQWQELEGARTVSILAIAVAVQWRNRGGDCARQTLDRALQEIEQMQWVLSILMF